uniref:Uncharacterized protein n=1 Tax=Tetranychus urticae TaxID=32264 RepID=T1KR64_TETUR
MLVTLHGKHRSREVKSESLNHQLNVILPANDSKLRSTLVILLF